MFTLNDNEYDSMLKENTVARSGMKREALHSIEANIVRLEKEHEKVSYSWKVL